MRMTKERAAIIRDASWLIRGIKSGKINPNTEAAYNHIKLIVNAEKFGIIETELFFEICERLVAAGL